MPFVALDRANLIKAAVLSRDDQFASLPSVGPFAR